MLIPLLHGNLLAAEIPEPGRSVMRLPVFIDNEKIVEKKIKKIELNE